MPGPNVGEGGASSGGVGEDSLGEGGGVSVLQDRFQLLIVVAPSRDPQLATDLLLAPGQSQG